jgi:hypothetical protein
VEGGGGGVAMQEEQWAKIKQPLRWKRSMKWQDGEGQAGRGEIKVKECRGSGGREELVAG